MIQISEKPKLQHSEVELRNPGSCISLRSEKSRLVQGIYGKPKGPHSPQNINSAINIINDEQVWVENFIRWFQNPSSYTISIAGVFSFIQKGSV